MLHEEASQRGSSQLRLRRPSGKLQRRRARLVRLPAGANIACYYHQCPVSGLDFLIDTGASLSLIPYRSYTKPVSEFVLRGANGSRIDTYGFEEREIFIGGVVQRWRFCLADTRSAILGADFLRYTDAVIDLKEEWLHFTPRKYIYQDCPTSFNPSVNFIDVLNQYPEITKERDASEVKHDVKHYIETTGPPSYQRARRLDPQKLKSAREEFDKLEKAGIIRKSKSQWASPLHMVPKGDGSFRPCGDYRLLNAKTIPDRYPIPLLSDFTNELAGSRVFSTIDLKKGYHQVPIHESDVPKTAVITPFGLYEYVAMPFGLRNAGATFQRLMNTILQDLPYVFCYVDDILVYSPDEESHREHLHAVFTKLRDAGLVVNKEKCVLGQRQVDFLGHRITAEGISPLPERVKDIKDFPAPTNVKELQRFLGCVNFYRRFCPSLANIVACLNTATTTKDWCWSEELQTAFDRTKEILCRSTMLVHPDPSASWSITVDASDLAIGGVLEQTKNGVKRPLGFFSRKLQGPELRYSAFDREL